MDNILTNDKGLRNRDPEHATNRLEFVGFAPCSGGLVDRLRLAT